LNLAIGRHRVTLQEWLRCYRQGGIESLLETKAPPGTRRSIPAWAEQALAKRLQEAQGFDSYGAIQEWLKSQLGIQAPYKTVHKLVHDRLESSPKVPRQVSIEQSSKQLEADKKISREPGNADVGEVLSIGLEWQWQNPILLW
jgi:transposase